MHFSFKRMSVIWIVIFTMVIGVSYQHVSAAPFKWNDREDFLQKKSSNIAIMGKATATKEQCVKYLLRHNPKPAIMVSPEKLVDFYYEEAQREGIKPDIAFAQALHETGYFRYGGLVVAQQNNYCGLGSVGASAKGAWFPNSQIGVRAHIQHILAYSSKTPPKTSIVDPRYRLVTTTKNFGKAKNWTDLNGVWAIPGRDYGEKILKIHRDILLQ